MPLEQGSGEEVFSHNVAELVKFGHPQKQAVAIAYKTKEGKDAALGTIKAAGILYIENNSVLLLKRPDGSWGFPGGKIEMGETPLDAALRESSEEVGFKPDRDMLWQIDFSNNGRVQFTTFCCRCGFEPILNTDEHSEYQWFAFGDLPDIVHPNALKTIERYTKSHLGFGLDSARTADFNGWIEIKDNPISKVGVFEYLGRNVDASFKPDERVRVLRPPEELNRQETIDSFKLIPWIDEHVMLGPSESGLTSPETKGIEGVIGENVYFDEANGRLCANIKVFSDNMDDLIAGGKRELSAGYRCRYEISSGVWNGQQYDAIQRDIKGNHLALVKAGRMGPDVAVLDHHMNFTFDARELTMAETEKEKEDKKAMDEVKSTLKEMGDSLKAMDKRIGAMDAKMGKDTGGDPDVDPAIAADKKAKDEAEEKKKDDEKKGEDKKAMDAAIKSAMDAAIAPLVESLNALKSNATKTVLSEVKRRNELANQLATFGIAVDSADMSLPELQATAVEKIGIKCEKGQEQIALDGYFFNRQAPADEVGFALDSRHTSGEQANAVKDFYSKPAA